MRRPHRRRGLSFAFEALQNQLIVPAGRAAKQLRSHELYRGGAREQPVPRQPDFAHAASPEQPLEVIAAHAPRFGDVTAEPVNDARSEVRHRGREDVREHGHDARGRVGFEVEDRGRRRNGETRGSAEQQKPADQLHAPARFLKQIRRQAKARRLAATC